MYNAKKYRIKEQKFFVSGKKQDTIKRRARRQSRKREQDIIRAQKIEAESARQKMLEVEMDNIVEYVEQGFFNRKCLEELIKKATTPYKHVSADGKYCTVTTGNESTCASVLSLTAVDNVLSDKRKNDELSRIEAKRRKLSGKKQKRTPNTTRSANGIECMQTIDLHDNALQKENYKKNKQKNEKDIEAMKDLLTEWGKLTAKKNTEAVTKNIAPSDPTLWNLLAPKQFTKAERQLFLKLCVANSGVLSKNETEQLKVLKDNNVTYLRLLAAVEATHKKLTALQKEYDERFSDSDKETCEEASVEEIDNVCCNEEEIEMIDEEEDL